MAVVPSDESRQIIAGASVAGRSARADKRARNIVCAQTAPTPARAVTNARSSWSQVSWRSRCLTVVVSGGSMHTGPCSRCPLFELDFTAAGAQPVPQVASSLRVSSSGPVQSATRRCGRLVFWSRWIPSCVDGLNAAQGAWRAPGPPDERGLARSQSGSVARSSPRSMMVSISASLRPHSPSRASSSLTLTPKSAKSSLFTVTRAPARTSVRRGCWWRSG